MALSGFEEVCTACAHSMWENFCGYAHEVLTIPISLRGTWSTPWHARKLITFSPQSIALKLNSGAHSILDAVEGSKLRQVSLL